MANIKIINAVIASGNMTLIRGDTYSGSDLEINSEVPAPWPDLTNAEVLFGMRYSGFTFVKPAVIASPAGTQIVQIELTSTDTAAMPVTET